MSWRPLHRVIAGLDAAIHDAVWHHLLTGSRARLISMDARVKSTHNE